ncbi:tRNA1(Val) (adenine(37)-N6)-methyltransferase [Syntrophomonas palmitatica]|uniref:tRNA1(Val) (adenine(37)-N6)-methyltransferase n=1 Tax=Syntrophomonas palmitatica TaxID=402877 RepID=UPI0006D2BE45|nr:tRNA1(Val) (adenine(37)-N6)-methyltransferase [Syntrophomonas palmitatica]
MTTDRSQLVYPGESLDDLILGGMKVIQARQGYRFSLDAVILAHFARLDGVANAVDLGTGSGVIPLLLALRDENIHITGIEIQDEAAERACRSVSYNGLSERIRIIQADMKDISQYLPAGQAQLVLSNPPFWKKGEGHVSQDPAAALSRHEIAVDLKGVVEAASYLLSPRGHFCFIHRTERLQEIIVALSASRLKLTRMRTVHSFPHEESRLVLLEAQKNGRKSLQILPPLFIYESPGNYGVEIRQWYGS